MGVILQAEQCWGCPNCAATDRTVGRPNRFHSCPALGGLDAPMVLDGTDCRVVPVERQDYIGDEDVRLTHGRPIMSVLTEYGDGRTDCVVYAPTARPAVVTGGM